MPARSWLALGCAALALACNRSPQSGAAGAAGAPAAARPEVTPRTPTDDWISSAVRSELVADGATEPSRIHVSTRKGVVVLRGTVDDLLARERAARAAMAIMGVRAVDDQILVQPTVAVSDEQIQREIERRIANDAAVDPAGVKVIVEGGEVTLDGKVGSWVEKNTAERLAKSVEGARAVHDELVVEWNVDRSDAQVEADARERLRWDARVNDGLLTVDVHDGDVVLDGKVGSLAEKQRAIADAWVVGAKNVDASKLEVEPATARRLLRRTKRGLKTDPEIKQALETAMQYDPRLDPDAVHVSVSDGIATLTGTVGTLKARLAAARIASDTVGVIEVKNLLVVKGPDAPTDDAIAGEIRDALRVDPITHSGDIGIEVNHGAVTLTGTAANYAAQAEAEDLANGTSGVTSVHDALRVEDTAHAFVEKPYMYPYYPYVQSWAFLAPRHQKNDAAIKASIERHLSFTPFVDARNVRVTVQDGRATLSGHVAGALGHRIAISDAYQGGATSVVDALYITR